MHNIVDTDAQTPKISAKAIAIPIIFALAGLLVSIVFAAVLSLLLSFTDLEYMAFITPIALVSTALGGATAGFLTAKRKGRTGFVMGLLGGLAYTIILSLFCLIVTFGFPNMFDNGGFWLIVACSVAAAGIGGIIGVNLGSKANNKYK